MVISTWSRSGSSSFPLCVHTVLFNIVIKNQQIIKSDQSFRDFRSYIIRNQQYQYSTGTVTYGTVRYQMLHVASWYGMDFPWGAGRILFSAGCFFCPDSAVRIRFHLDPCDWFTSTGTNWSFFLRNMTDIWRLSTRSPLWTRTVGLCPPPTTSPCGSGSGTSPWTWSTLRTPACTACPPSRPPPTASGLPASLWTTGSASFR